MLTVLRSALVVIAVAAPAVAEEKPVGLSPKEAAEGWLMLFDGETTFGWKVDGEATVKDGKLVVGGRKATTLTTIAVLPPGVASVTFDGPPKASNDKAVPWLTRAGLEDGGVMLCGADGKARSVVIDVPADRVAIRVPAGQTVRITSLAFRPNPKQFAPLFNGKDLTGWHVFKDATREKATYTVTPAGELHVLGGPGDLQTDAKFADFVFQAEVKTNGPTVNSGFFFRCVPGQYQNGYECQIQNAFKDGDRTKPTDGGTGAIYRRQPARKVVPNDKEWFTLTIAANGPHLATWVNGYPTANWTDERKPHENPRTGLRTEAGHLSIQGHNPPMSADVLFRNVRIAEVKK